jgi:hypothetical protein
MGGAVLSSRPASVVAGWLFTACSSALISATLRTSASRTTCTIPNGPSPVGTSINVCTST